MLGSCVAAAAAERSENKCYCIALRKLPALHQRWPKVLVTAYEASYFINFWVGSVQRETKLSHSAAAFAAKSKFQPLN